MEVAIIAIGWVVRERQTHEHPLYVCMYKELFLKQYLCTYYALISSLVHWYKNSIEFGIRSNEFAEHLWFAWIMNF